MTIVVKNIIIVVIIPIIVIVINRNTIEVRGSHLCQQEIQKT